MALAYTTLNMNNMYKYDKIWHTTCLHWLFDHPAYIDFTEKYTQQGQSLKINKAAVCLIASEIVRTLLSLLLLYNQNL